MAQNEPAVSARRAARDAERAARTWVGGLFGSRGWSVAPSESLVVSIVSLGVPPGAKFEMVLRVVDDPRSVLRVSADQLRRFAESQTPVVFVACAAGAEDGRWQTARELVRSLDDQPGWQNRRMLTVTPPDENRLDAAGLDALQKRVMRELWEPIGAATPKPLTLEFVDSPEGREALVRMTEAMRAGLPATIDGKDVTLHLPWLPDGAAPIHPSVVEIKPALRRMRFEVQRAGVMIAALEVPMRIASSDDGVEATSEAGAPLAIRFKVARGGQATFGLKREPGSMSVDAELPALSFFLALARGGELHVFVVGRADAIMKASVQPQSFPIAELARRHALLVQLRFVERSLAARGRPARFEVPEDISVEAADEIEELVRIVRDGEIRGNHADMVFTVPPSSQLPADDGEVSVVRTNGMLELFGASIPLGDVKSVVVDPDAFLKRVRDKAAEGGGQIELRDLVVDDTYLDWQPSTAWKSLVDLATEQGGYILERQIEETGSTELDVEVAIANGELERVGGAPRALRLVSVEHHGDAELWRIWLETDKLGVFSHETALAHYDLSDVMPNRIHVTVPEDVDLELPGNVVVHVAQIPEDDREWNNDLPFTTPARAVRDCRADHLSLEFVEQAERQGIARGLFQRSDLGRS